VKARTAPVSWTLEHTRLGCREDKPDPRRTTEWSSGSNDDRVLKSPQPVTLLLVNQSGDSNERRTGYEGWMDELAGKRVSTAPFAILFFILSAVVVGVGYLAGLRGGLALALPVAALSVPFWMYGVPAWISRRHRKP
jgi:hypothetical protein